MATSTDGRWITSNGTHIFIKNGQSVGDAITEHAAKHGAKKERKKERSASEIVADVKALKERTFNDSDELKEAMRKMFYIPTSDSSSAEIVPRKDKTKKYAVRWDSKYGITGITSIRRIYDLDMPEKKNNNDTLIIKTKYY